MSSYRSVEFVSAGTASAREGTADTIVISINNTFDPINRLKPGWKDVLVQQFDDVEGLSRNPRYQSFSRQHADDIVAFLHKYEDSVDKVLVHCVMGEKRSAAVAKIVAQMYGLSFPQGYDKFHTWVYEVLLYVLELDWVD